MAVARQGTHHVHGLDLAPIADLAVVGTFAGPADAERRGRLVRWLDDEIARRRAAPDNEAVPILIVIDDLGGPARAHDPVRDAAIHDRFGRIWADGPAVGVTVAVSVRRAADLLPAMAATVGTVLLHRTADQGEALRFNVKAALGEFPAGRAGRASDGAHVHVIRDGASIAAGVAAFAGPQPPGAPHDVGELTAVVPFDHADVGVVLANQVAHLTVAIADRDLRGHALVLHHGEHALVIGPPRSGRTNTLAAIYRAAGGAAIVVGDGPLARQCGVVPSMPAVLDSAIQGRGATLVLVDDATDVEDPTGALAALVTAPPPGVHVVAAVRPDRLRGAYGHWATEIRVSRRGILLRPDPMDADLLGGQLPARLALPALPGRGVVMGDAVMEIVQVVLADEAAQSTS
jgi:S-DNA-T family DNA segregation ATPase FtsK/SpoIIIE